MLRNRAFYGFAAFTAAVLVLVAVPEPADAHIIDNSGAALQLFSYRMTGPEPVLDGDIATIDPDEWKEAYNRRIILTPEGDAANDTATLLIMNNDSCLFIALAYEWDNTGEENLIELYFDEGAGGGSHDDALSGGHENAIIYEKDDVRHDLYWDGSAWTADGDSAADFDAAWDWSATINNIEFRIPLNSLKSDDASNSDLDVDADDEIGFLFKIFKMGKGFSNYVSWTMFPDTVPGIAADYADLKLGVERKYVTFYATHAAVGTPDVTDGIIGGDDGWRGCYYRNLVMTNFAGDVRAAGLYLVEDAAADDIYIGFRMEDDAFNAGDRLRVYGEQAAGLAADTYDAKLNSNAENCLQLAADGTFTDMYFLDAATNYGPGTWELDGDADAQTGAVTYDAADNRYDFELRVVKDGGTRDLDLNDNAVSQLLVEYYDADMPAGERYYYWSVSTNNVQILADQSVTPPNRVAIGWSKLQLGAPYVQVVYPSDGAVVSGDVNVRVYAEDENADGIVSAACYRAGDTATVYGLTRIAGMDEWSGTWNTNTLANGAETLIVRVTDDDGNSSERLVELEVSNGAGAVAPPAVAVTLPAPGSRVGGVVNLQFSATGSAAIVTTEISIDGGAYAATSAGTAHSWNTAALVQGTHTVRIRAVDANGSAGYSEVTAYIVDNAPTVAVTAPAAGATVSDTVTVSFAATASAPATVESTFISIDGGAYTVTATGSSAVVPTAALNDGNHTVRILIKDSGGRTGVSASVMFGTDNAPAVAITSPDPDSVVSGSVEIGFLPSVIPSATVSTAEISLDGGPYIPATSLASHTLVTDSLADGSHLVRIRVTDSNGRSALSPALLLSVYNTPAVIITAPVAGASLSGTALVTFTVIMPGSASVQSTEIAVDGGAWRATSSAADDTLDTQGLSDGPHSVQVRVTDSAGKTGYSRLVNIIVSNAPAVTVASPLPDATVRDTVIVSFNAVPVAPAVIESTYISVDGGGFVSTTTGSTHLWASGPVGDGAHILQIKAVDTNGKAAVSQLVKVVTANSPSLAVTAPAADAVLSGTIVVVFEALPIASATVTTAEISVDGSAWRATTAAATDTLDTQGLSDGAHLLQVRVTDSNGKSAVSPFRMVTVRNAPAVALTAPVPGSLVSGSAAITFTAVPVSPAVIESTFISLDGGAWIPTATGSTHVLSTVNLLDGTHSLCIRAVDNNGKTGTTASVNFITKNSPAVTFTAPEAGAALNGAVIVRFSVSPVAPAAVDSVLVSVDGGAYASTDDESTYVWNTALLRDGEHIVRLRVVDDRGKTGESEVLLVTTDNTAPVITAAAVSYDAVSAVSDSGSIGITSFIFDKGAGVNESAVYLAVPVLGIDSLPITDVGITGDRVYGTMLRPGGLASGMVAYTLSAADILGNIATITDSFYFDGTPPLLSVTVSPLAEDGTDSLHGNSYFPRVLLKGGYSDVHSGVDRATVRITPGPGDGTDLVGSPLVLDAEAPAFCVPLDLVEGSNYITVTVRDNAGNRVQRDISLTYVPPKVTGDVGSDGGTVVNPNGTMISVPEGALAGNMSISITRIDAAELPMPFDGGMQLLGSAYDFGPDGTIFRKEVTLTLAYTQAELDVDGDGAADLDESALSVYFLDGTAWLPAGEAVTDTAANTVSVAVNHFTVYAIGAAPAEPPASSYYWTRNPVLRSAQSTFVFELETDATVALHILDMAGDLVRTILPDTDKPAGSYSVKWDGDNAQDVFAGTGLYVYLFRVETPAGVTVIKKPIAIINK